MLKYLDPEEWTTDGSTSENNKRTPSVEGKTDKRTIPEEATSGGGKANQNGVVVSKQKGNVVAEEKSRGRNEEKNKMTTRGRSDSGSGSRDSARG